MKISQLVTLIVLLSFIQQACNLAEPIAGEEYDDVYFSSADIKADQAPKQAAIVNSSSPFSESTGAEEYASQEVDYYDSSYIENLNKKYTRSSVYSYSDPYYASRTMWNPYTSIYAGTGFGVGSNYYSNSAFYDSWNSPYSMGYQMGNPYYSGYPIYSNPWGTPFYSSYAYGYGGYPYAWATPYNNRFVPYADKPVYKVRRPNSYGQRDPSKMKDNQSNNPYVKVNNANATGKRGASGASNARNARDTQRYNYNTRTTGGSNSRSRSVTPSTNNRGSYSRPSRSSGTRTTNPRSGGSPR